MVLHVSLTAPSFRGLVVWLRAFLRHTSGCLKTCLRLMFALAWKPSTRFRIIEGNEGERRTSVSSWASPCIMTPNMESTQIPATNDPASCSMPEANVTALAQHPATNLPGNLALTDMYITSFTHRAEVEDENRTNLELRPILALDIQKQRYERYGRHLKNQLPQSYSYPAPPGVPDFSEYESFTLCMSAC